MKLVFVILGLINLTTTDPLSITDYTDLYEEPELEEEFEEEPDAMVDPDSTKALPEELDLREKGIMHKPVNQGSCPACGWVAGTQTLEARIALVAENHIPYSIQNFMNCAGRPCVGVQPYSVTTQVKQNGVIVPEDEVPFTKRQCVGEGEGKSACFAKCGARHPASFNNTLHDQFVIVAGTGNAETEAQLMEALQDGPVTTCFSKKSVETGERCSNGCAHANSIIGYTKDKWLLQESYGGSWGGLNDGSWLTTKGSKCSVAIIKKAYFPRIFYDYDRANAYYTPVEGGVSEKELKFVDGERYGITKANRKNVGTAKNKCAFLGAACKGVVALSSGVFELVSNFGPGSIGDQDAFMKVQMVVYLKHEELGKYIMIKEKKKKLTAVDSKEQASPFFTSYGRFVSFQYPSYHLVDNKMERILGGLNDIDIFGTWALANCNIYNDVSGNSFDLVEGAKGKTYLGGSKYDPTSLTQQFNIGLSGDWTIESSKLKQLLAERKNLITFTDDSKAAVKRFRWNARQIINNIGHPFTPDMVKSKADFKFEDNENAMRPRNCGISKLIPMGWGDHLAMENNEIVMSSNVDRSWTFEYSDL